MTHQVYKVIENGQTIFLAIAVSEGSWSTENRQRSAMGNTPSVLGENLSKVVSKTFHIGIDVDFPNSRRMHRMRNQVMSVHFPLTDEEIMEFSKAYDEKRSEKESDKFMTEHPGI